MRLRECLGLEMGLDDDDPDTTGNTDFKPENKIVP